jgi:TRAP-type mannitol/chloroaromatic compound transport system substrate-binding protein
MAPDLVLSQLARHDLRGATTLAQYLSEATDGNFELQVFPAGELVPASRPPTR